MLSCSDLLAVRTDDFRQREIGIVQRVLCIDDALFGRVVKRLCLFDVAAWPDARLLARSGLVEQAGEGLALAAIRRQLIPGRQDAEIRDRHPQHEVLLCALPGGLGGRGLEIRLLQQTECLIAP